MMTALSFGACDNDDDDDTFVPPSNITEALKQVYPAAQNVEWEMKGAYYVADCWVSNDELEVWFDANGCVCVDFPTKSDGICDSGEAR